jgi:hypothetical protein
MTYQEMRFINRLWLTSFQQETDVGGGRLSASAVCQSSSKRETAGAKSQTLLQNRTSKFGSSQRMTYFRNFQFSKRVQQSHPEFSANATALSTILLQKILVGFCAKHTTMWSSLLVDRSSKGSSRMQPNYAIKATSVERLVSSVTSGASAPYFGC